ncbi:HNH endonuclease [Hallella faecis]|uniref:HNH endonuclease n=1 Tax=Hallella faecis TaxID=2841596 RepID=A0ABV1FRF6_9BACT|nr:MULTISPECIES: HNH endonuclease [Hallella]MBU0290175.1 HNH endonuclease [Hallella faecis]MED9945153.1 HNH endonuclease [Hallella sp.]
MQRNLWTHDELVLALALYFQLPFGRLNRNTPEVRELGRLLGRGENSAALRLVNFAACDPYILATGRHGMASGAKTCMPVWEEYANNKERLFKEAAEIRARLQQQSIEQSLGITTTDLEGKTREAVVRQRVNQNVFRTMILNNYNEQCAITGINDSRLLVASHIIPWAERKDTRLNPENGICLSSLYDRAFDQGLITIRPDDYTVMVSPSLRDTLTQATYAEHFGKIANRKIILPEEHQPNGTFLQYHAENIYIR